MTYIEFFVRDSVENVCACLASAPDRVIILGDKLRVMRRHAENYAAVFSARGDAVEFICRSVNRNDLESVISVLGDIIESYDDCAFGITGGDEMCLVAMGVLLERYRDRGIQVHRFNIRNNRIIDCDGDGKTVFDGDSPSLTVCENVRIYGGEVINGASPACDAKVMRNNAELRSDIDSLWEVCRRDPSDWNSFVGLLASCEGAMGEGHPPLLLEIAVERMQKQNRGFNSRRFSDSRLTELSRRGLIRNYSFDGNTLRFEFKNNDVKNCLTKAGLVLEMKIFLTALECREHGAPVYGDGATGVRIDWDGEISGEGRSSNIENEIDVMLMHGMVPVFISCKNGRVDTDELYKLSTVAERFGGKYAKKVLVATALDERNALTGYLRQRAHDMGIRLIDDAQSMDGEELVRTLSGLWKN